MRTKFDIKIKLKQIIGVKLKKKSKKMKKMKIKKVG